MPRWKKLSFTDSVSPLIEKIIQFHDHIIIILVLVTCFIIYIIILTLIKVNVIRILPKHHDLEIIWTCLPGGLLLLVAFPSLYLLYLSEESPNPLINIKIIGHQWYWTYEYSNNIEIESYMSLSGNFRLLDTTQYPLIISNSILNLLVSSVDVIHSWTLPSRGVKIDAIPGRINRVPIRSNHIGTYYGQCSEICGSFHSFIPIKLEVIPIRVFPKLAN